MYDGVIEIIGLRDQDVPHADKVMCRLLRTTMDILGGHSRNLKLKKWGRVRDMLAHLSTSDSNEEGNVGEDFLRRYTEGK